MVKPFSPKELMLRVEAVLKRSRPGSSHSVVSIGELTVDFTARTVTLAGSPVALSPKEYELLFYKE